MKKRYGKLAGHRRSGSENEFSKWIAGFLMFNGTVWIYLSYGLAYCGKESVQALSIAVVAEIVGVAAVYQIKAFFESRNNHRGWREAASKRNADRDI